MLMHFIGDPAALEALEEAAQLVEEMRKRHVEERGRPLRVILVSDHGNTFGKVAIVVDAIKAALQEAGLRNSKKLKHANDVVLAAYGVVGYAAFFSDPANAETIATALSEVEGVAFAAWQSDEHEISVRTAEGLARVDWLGPPSARRLRYVPERGDPLGLIDALAAMEDEGDLDAGGFASREDWFTRTASADNPDGLARLTDSLSGTWVANPATVIVGLKPGYACGGRSVRIGAWFKGGHLEATHGGLDRDSSWGFFLDSDPGHDYPPVLRVDRALAEFADEGAPEVSTDAGP
jgi:hypothetical protein